MASRLKEVVKNLEREIENHVLDLEPQLLSLLKTALYVLIQRETSLSPEVLKTSLRQALSHVVEQTRVKIRLNPADLEFLEDIIVDIRDEFSKLKDFEIVPDAEISRGGCLLETDFGLVDATLERKWREIWQKIEK